MDKALIINPFGIGDVLFTTPLIKAIKDSFPQAKIAYWCNERVAPIFNGNPAIDKVFALSRGDLKKHFQSSKIGGIGKFLGLVSALKKERFKVAFDFSLDHRYGLISKWLRIPKRVGYNYKSRGRFLTHRIDIAGFNSRHIVEYYLELLRFVDIIPKEKKLDLFVSAENKESCRGLLAREGIKEDDLLVGIAPGAGASWGENAYLKHWPAENFALLADKIAGVFNARIIILGDEKEKGISGQITGLMRASSLDFTGKTTLPEFAGLISNLGLLITNDGGPLHIAVALGIKTVSIFGPVNELVYGPYPAGERHIVIKKDMDCRPCYKDFRMPECNNNRICIESISVDEVFSAVKKLV